MKLFSKYVMMFKKISCLLSCLLITDCFAGNMTGKQNIDFAAIGKAIDEFAVSRFEERQEQQSEALTALKKISKLEKQTDKFSTKSCHLKTVYTGELKKLDESKCFVVANVGKDVVTNIDIINAIKFIFFSSGKKFDKVSANLMLKQVLFSLIKSKLQQQYAKFYNITVKESELDARIQIIAENNNLTVEKLIENFEQSGINLEIFKKNLKSRMILSFLVDIISDDVGVSESELEEEKNKLLTDLKSRRYHILEIFFRVDSPQKKQATKDLALSTLKLLKEGFDFSVLSETMSQGNYSKNIGDLGWVREDNLETPVKNVIKKLTVGNFSDIIETRTGFKIVYLNDKAEPNKAGKQFAQYHVLKTNMQYKGGFWTQKDVNKAQSQIEQMLTAKTAKEFKETCAKNNASVSSEILTAPNSYYLELIEASRQNKKPAILQDMENQDNVNILLFDKEEIPDAVIPTKEDVREKVTSSKISKNFSRQFDKIEHTSHITIRESQLLKVFS